MWIRTRPLYGCLPWLALGWLVPGRVMAERPPDPPPGGTARPRPFDLNFSDLYLGFEGDYQQRRVTSEPRGRRETRHENRDLHFRETLGLGLDGSVYDPNLLEWRAALEFGLIQGRFVEDVDGRRETDGDSGFLLEYDVSIDAFKNKPVSLNAYARRSDDRVPRRFLPSLRESQTEAGASVLALYGPFTTEVGFAWRDVDRRGNKLDEDDERLETTRFFIDHKWQISDTHRLKVTYEHERQESTYQGSLFDFDTRRDEVRVEHELAFGPQDRHRLDTFLRFNEEQGDLARDEIEFVPRLTLEHSDRFKTIYRYGLYRFDQDSLRVEQHKFDVQALYRPSDRWRISVDGFALYEDVDRDVQTYEFGVGTDVSYNRPTSLGELSANLGLAYERARTSGDTGRRVVRGEAHQLDEVRPTYLRETGVIRSTVLARNAARTRYYLEGLDYTAAIVGGRAIVRRVPTGRISEDEAVYFDYSYLVPTRATVDSFRTDLLLEHSFKFGLTPYYYFEGRFQRVDSSPAAPLLRDNQDRHRLGLRYGGDRWSVGAEYEIFDDSIEPYDAFHLTGHAALFRTGAHSLDLSAELSRYWFEGGFDDRRVWWLEVDLKDKVQLSRYFSLITGAAYRREDDSVDGETNGVDVEVGLRYDRDFLSVELTMEYDLLSIADNRDDGFGVFLNVRRDLSHLLASSRSAR